MKQAELVLIGTVMVAGLVGAVSRATAQGGDPNHEWCQDRYRGWRDDDRDRYCEVREFTLTGRNVVAVDGGPNGGIDVVGWDRNDIQVQAMVQTWDRRSDEAAALAREIEIVTSGTIRADGPRGWRGRRETGWSVSYRLRVPMHTNLDLETVNGGIGITDVHGEIVFHATNGGIDLSSIGGDVRGGTTNGGIHVDLEGSQWEGRGLDVETTNGGVTVTIPRDFRAELTTGTVNGGLQIDFPITIQGRINHRRITTDLNGGGPPIRAVTTNGGVTIRRR
jgi:Toastrack DUF4097